MLDSIMIFIEELAGVLMFCFENFNEMRKRDKIRGLPSILSSFRNEFNKFNNT